MTLLVPITMDIPRTWASLTAVASMCPGMPLTEVKTTSPFSPLIWHVGDSKRRMQACLLGNLRINVLEEWHI